MRSLARFAPILTTALGLGLAAPASAALPPGDPDAVARCRAAFDAGTDSALQLVTNPAPRSDVAPGAEVHLAAGWAAGNWEAVSSVLACVRLFDDINGELSAAEAVPLDDGSFDHRFAVPDGLFAGTVICTRMRLDGDPVGEALSGSWVSKQACFEVHPEQTTPPPPTSTPPPPAVPSPAPVPAPPAAPSAPAPVAPRVSAEPAAPTPSFGTPAMGVVSPGLATVSPVPAPASGPVPLLELPRTGAGLGPLAAAGLTALAAGLPALALGRRSAGTPRSRRPAPRS